MDARFYVHFNYNLARIWKEKYNNDVYNIITSTVKEIHNYSKIQGL